MDLLISVKLSADFVPSICSVVLDEVDILFGEEGFEQVLHQLITVAPVTTQYLFVTATLPLDIYNKVVETFPDCEVIMGPGVHRTSSRLEEVSHLSLYLFITFYYVTCSFLETSLGNTSWMSHFFSIIYNFKFV